MPTSSDNAIAFLADLLPCILGMVGLLLVISLIDGRGRRDRNDESGRD